MAADLFLSRPTEAYPFRWAVSACQEMRTKLGVGRGKGHSNLGVCLYGTEVFLGEDQALAVRDTDTLGRAANNGFHWPL